jgi:hypothetical protein
LGAECAREHRLCVGIDRLSHNSPFPAAGAARVSSFIRLPFTVAPNTIADRIRIGQ